MLLVTRAGHVILGAVCFLAGCRPAPSHATKANAPPKLEARPPEAPIYLEPTAAGGGRDCLDPNSEVVRKALTAKRTPADVVDATRIADDVVVLRSILEREYSGYAELLQHPSFDAGRFFRDWEARLRSGPKEITFEAAMLRELVALKAATGDRHLSIPGMSKYLREEPSLASGEFEAADTPVDLASCSRADGPELVVETVRRASTLAADGKRSTSIFASARGRGDALVLRCGSASMTLTRRAPGAWPKRPPLYEFRSAGGAGILVVGQLWGASVEERERLGQIAKDIALHTKHEILVFDFRQNGGGNDGYVFDWANRASASTVTLPPYVEGAQARRCGPWNQAVDEQIAEGRVDQPDAQKEREEILTEARALGNGPSFRSGERVFSAAKPYRGRVFVLLDRGSASSAEGSANALATALGATLIGERSGGYFEYGELAPFVLPRSGVVWHVPTKRWYTPQPVEGVGLPVDVYLAPDLLARDAAELVPLLRKLPPRSELRGAKQ